MSTTATSGLCASAFRRKAVGVSGLADDVESRVGQQTRDPFTQQNVVLPEDHPDGLRHTATLSITRFESEAAHYEAGRPTLRGA